MAEQTVLKRRTVLGLFLVAAAPPLIGHVPETDEIAFLHEDWIDNPNDFGMLFRAVGQYKNNFCSGACAVDPAVLRRPDLRAHVRKEMRKQMRTYFISKGLMPAPPFWKLRQWLNR